MLTLSASRKSSRRLILGTTVLLLVLSLWAGVQILISPLGAEGSQQRNWFAALHRPPGFVRYLIIPHVAQTLERAQLNPTLQKLIRGNLLPTLLTAPPPTALGALFQWLEIVPETIKPSLLRALLPSGLGYVASEKGAILVAPVSLAGQALLASKKPAFSAFKGGDFIYASSEALLEAQLAHQTHSWTPPLVPAPGDIGIVLSPENNRDKEESQLLLAFYRAFFPPDMVGPQSFVLSLEKNGIWVQSKAFYPKEKLASLQKSISSLATLKYLPSSLDYDGLLLELTADSKAIAGFMQSQPQNRERQPLTWYLHRFVADLGRILPEVALIADSKDYTLTHFFEEAFRKGNYSQQVTEGVTQLSYSWQEDYEPQLVSFSPHYSFTKDAFLWASGKEAFFALKAIYQQPKRTTSNYTAALTLHGFKSPERILAGVSGNLKTLLQSLEIALSQAEAFYDRASYGDFHNSLSHLLKDIPKANVTGFLMLHPEYLRGSLLIQL